MRKQFKALFLIIVSLFMLTGCLKTAKDQEKLREEVIGYLEQMAEIEKREGWPVALAQKVSKIGRPAVPILLEVIEDVERDWRMKAYAAGFFESPKFSSHPTVVPTAIEILRTSNNTGKRFAAEILGHTKDKRTVKPLIEVLENCKDKEVIKAVIQALGKIGDKRAVEPMLKFLNDPNYVVRIVVVRDGLGKIDGEKAVEGLIKALKPTVRVENGEIAQRLAAETLGNLNATKAILPLEEALKNSNNDISVREDAAKALKEITGKVYKLEK